MWEMEWTRGYRHRSAQGRSCWSGWVSRWVSPSAWLPSGGAVCWQTPQPPASPVTTAQLGMPAVVPCSSRAELHPPTSPHLSWPGRFPQPLCQLLPGSVDAVGQAASRSLPVAGWLNVAISRVRCSRWCDHTQLFAFLSKQILVFHKVYDLNIYSIYL